MNKELEHFLKALINRLTDYDIEQLNNDTPIAALDLVSLDFVTIKVEAKKTLDVDIDLNALAEAKPNTFGELMAYLQNKYVEEK
ncbi:acyl carrier protein [Kosakonia sp. BYX6]|uniref:Acyl carrier protein n=1 Tax=Kosakonia calanthes TaxID=3139408 RepID=A0ABZ3B4Q0_9ENTR